MGLYKSCIASFPSLVVSCDGRPGNEDTSDVMASQEKREFDKYLKFLTFKVLE